MTIKCPKCGHVRSERDDPLIPDYQCPACDVVYQKYIQLQAKKRESHHTQKTQQPHENHDGEPSLLSSVFSFIGSFARFAGDTFTRSGQPRTEPMSHQEPEVMVKTKAKPKPSVSDTEKIIALSEIGQIRTSHLLHLVLTLVTVGLWIIPWIFVTVSNTMERNKIRRRAQLPTESNWMGVALSVLAIGIFIALAGACTKG